MTYTVYEAATLVGVNPETIRRWIRSGRLIASISSKKQAILLAMWICKECITKTCLLYETFIKKKNWKRKG